MAEPVQQILPGGVVVAAWSEGLAGGCFGGLAFHFWVGFGVDLGGDDGCVPEDVADVLSRAVIVPLWEFFVV